MYSLRNDTCTYNKFAYTFILFSIYYKPKTVLDQLEDLLGPLPASRTAPDPVPAPVQETVPMVEKFLQQLVAKIQSRQPAAVTKPKPPPVLRDMRVTRSTLPT